MTDAVGHFIIRVFLVRRNPGVASVAGQLGLKSSRPLSQVGPGSTRPESTRPGVFSEGDLRLSRSIIRKSRLFFTKEWRNISQNRGRFYHSKERLFQVMTSQVIMKEANG